MQADEQTRTIIFVSTRKPEHALRTAREVCDLCAFWAASIAGAVTLINLALGRTLVITELALVDGNWSDLVERLGSLGRRVTIVLVAAVTTAELWWDALDCGVEDILTQPISGSQLCALLNKG